MKRHVVILHLMASFRESDWWWNCKIILVLLSSRSFAGISGLMSRLKKICIERIVTAEDLCRGSAQFSVTVDMSFDNLPVICWLLGQAVKSD